MCVCWITISFRNFRCKYAHENETVNTQINMLTSIHVCKQLFNGLHFTYRHNYCTERLSQEKYVTKVNERVLTGYYMMKILLKCRRRSYNGLQKEKQLKVFFISNTFFYFYTNCSNFFFIYPNTNIFSIWFALNIV